MRRRWPYALFGITLGGLLAWNIFAPDVPTARVPDTPSAPASDKMPPEPLPERIVSLAPSLTETLFALGAEKRLVGVTARCRFPDAARDLPKIGDYNQPNYEAIKRTRPDIVLALEEHRPAFPRFDELGLRYMVFDHRSLAGLLDSFDRLGELVAAREEGNALRARLEETIARYAFVQTLRSSARPRTLLVLGRDYAAERPTGIWAVGPANLYDELLRAAGGENVCADELLPFPELGTEGVVRLRPAVVVELLGMEPDMPTPEASRAVWAKAPGFTARVEVIRGDAAFVPGPRTADFLEEFARAIHGGDRAQPAGAKVNGGD